MVLGTYHLAAVNSVRVGNGNESRDLLLDIPFGPGLLIFRLIPKMRDRDLQERVHAAQPWFRVLEFENLESKV